MGVFSDREIFEAIDRGQIVIDPLVKDNVKGSSVDLRLGYNYYKAESLSNVDFYNPFDKDSVNDYFKGPLQAMPHAEWCARHGRTLWRHIAPDHPIIVLWPQERILAHTVEFAGIRFEGTTKMQARSTWGRNGVVVCKDAGWGDPGYVNRWTMEIQNDNKVCLPLPVGVRMAQLVFYHMGPSDRDYGDDGKYQAGSDIEAIKRSWRPEQMLPQSYRDNFVWNEAMIDEVR